MMPGSAAGSTTVNTARARVAPERQRALLQALRYEPQQLLGRPHDERDHHDAQRDAAGQRRELLERQHGDAVREHADHDRRNAVERVGGEADGLGELRSGIFRRVDAAQDADRDRECGADATTTTDPTMALAIPPPGSPTGFGMSTMNDQFSDVIPWVST